MNTDSVPSRPDFELAWGQAERIKGWLTREQARTLFDAAAGLPAGSKVLEIGSHQGRSTVVLGAVAKATGGQVLAVDPFVDGRLFGGVATKDLFEANLATAGVAEAVELHQAYSTQLRPTWTQDFGFLYIDGKHDYWTLSDDLLWSRHLPSGGQVAVHDCFSSIGVTLGVIAHVLFGRDLRYLRRAGSLALFEVGKPSLADRRRLAAQLPWWVRNVGIKILLRLRLRPVARAFGHDSVYDPY